MFKHPVLAAAFMACAVVIAAGAAHAGDARIHVGSRAYDVAVAPVDRESRDADSAVLYERAGPDDDWQELGECRRIKLPNGDVRFTREVDVDADGIYEYTSRPVVNGAVVNPPEPDDPPQAVVVVDTLPPTAELISPAEGDTYLPGELVPLAWTVSDENLPEHPAALGYSTDGGRSWNTAIPELPATGDMTWEIPDTLTGPVVLRLAARDRAGNIGRDLRLIEEDKPVAVQPPPVDTPPVERELPPKELPPPDSVTVIDGPVVDEVVEDRFRDPNRSWLYYLMALNQMRQNKPAEALQYYWLSVKYDPDFVNAWADLALAYNELGAYETARDIVEQTRDIAPDRIDLLHLLGETYHAQGMDLLTRARDSEERMEAKALIDQAVAWYGRTLERAAAEWRLAEQAASFYRLGEVCYYVNLDRDGARAYWEKILKLHIPKPNHDLVKWSSKKFKDEERRRLEKNTDQWVALNTWQNWARGYLEQLDARERAGILDLMQAQRVNRHSGPADSLSYSGNELNPGRDDGRSLFSLPAQLGSGDDDIAACVGYSDSTGTGGYNSGPGTSVNEINFPAHMNRPPVTDGYSFYAPTPDPNGDSRRAAPSGRNRRRGGLLSGGGTPPPPPATNPDPYVFPQGGRALGEWTGTGPYGNEPIKGW